VGIGGYFVAAPMRVSPSNACFHAFVLKERTGGVMRRVLSNRNNHLRIAG
jgi:hypothetical protein